MTPEWSEPFEAAPLTRESKHKQAAKSQRQTRRSGGMVCSNLVPAQDLDVFDAKELRRFREGGFDAFGTERE